MKYVSKLFAVSICSVLLLFSSCQHPVPEISKVFSCKNIEITEELERVDDFKQNFSIAVPKQWKTKLYYDNKESEIFSADTIKTITDTYIMDFSSRIGSIEIDDVLKEKVRQKTMNNNLKMIEESFHNFKGYAAYAHLGKGKSKGMDLYVFQYYIKINNDKYMLIKTEFYGEENFDSRFCESLALIEKIKIQN